jgi:L-alanine-DL-glutamate epimerase-like enolase superfamily enzyme
MRISDLEFYMVEVPRRGPHGPVRSVLVRMATSDGVDGWGEGQLAWRSEELADRRDALLSVLAGRSVFDIEELLSLEALSAPALRAAVEMAAWDTVGRLAGQPLANLWGGLFRRRVPLAVRLPQVAPRHAGRLASELAEQGFHAQVVSTSGRPTTDRQVVRAARQGAGDRAEVWFDGRGQYRLEAACELCEAIGPRACRWWIDPLAAGEIDHTAQFRRTAGAAVAISIGIRSAADVLAVIRADAADAIVVDPEQSGGISAARRAATVAEAAGLAVLCGGSPALGLAAAARLHLVAATPSFAGATESAYPTLLDDVLAEPLTIVDGQGVVPQGPGLGVEIDRARLDAFAAPEF